MRVTVSGPNKASSTSSTPASAAKCSGRKTAIITPMTAPASTRTRTSSGGRPTRRASAPPTTLMTRANSLIVRARISGTSMLSRPPSLISSHSSGVNERHASASAARIAGIGASSGGCLTNASTSLASMSSWRTRSSLVGK
jgi:hypothetical protein